MTQTPWLTPDELRAWVRLIAVVEMLPGALDTQLQRDAGLSHFEYFTLAMLSEAPGRTLRMTELASQTNASLPRLSHVVKRLVARGYVSRRQADDDRRAIEASLTDEGLAKIQESAPGHVRRVRELVIDALTPEQVAAVGEAAAAILTRLDPQGRMNASVLENVEDQR
jgi:DNA-binding MarR family transcriptional regulator